MQRGHGAAISLNASEIPTMPHQGETSGTHLLYLYMNSINVSAFQATTCILLPKYAAEERSCKFSACSDQVCYWTWNQSSSAFTHQVWVTYETGKPSDIKSYVCRLLQHLNVTIGIGKAVPHWKYRRSPFPFPWDPRVKGFSFLNSQTFINKMYKQNVWTP